MANLNLSEFTEKLFVADADHTFIWDTAASISKRVSRNSWLNSGTLTSDAPVTISQTWNNAAVGFNALVVNAAGTSGTNSASGSLLLNLQVNTASAFFVRKDGAVYGAANAVFGNSVGVGLFGSTLSFYAGAIGGGRNAVSIANGWSYAFSSGAQAVSNQDVFLTRDDVGTLALRNGAAAQTFNVYGTSSASNANYARLALTCGLDGNATISTQALGTGTAGVLAFSPSNTERMRITTAGNVGIGTTAPVATLHVNGGELDQDTKRVALFQSNDVNIQNNFSVVGITSSDTTVNTFQHRLLDLDYTTASASTGTYIRMLRGGNEKAGIALANDEFVITGEAVERLRISAAGNVGIGTTSPTSKLHVAGDAFLAANGSNTAPSLRIGAGAYVNGWYSFGGLQLNGVVNSLNMFGINLAGTNISAGNLSFGSGDAVFERDGEQDHIAMRRGALGQKFSVYGTYPGAAWERFTITAPTSGNVLLGTYKGTGGIARGLEFQTDGVTRMTINAAGTLVSATNVINAASFSVTGSNILALSHNGVSLTLGNSSWVTQHNGIGLTFSGSTDSFPAIIRDGAGLKFTGAAAGLTAWIKVPPVAVGSLPLAATAGAGARAFVNDALAPTFGSAVTGGGAVLVPVYSDGSAWHVG